MKRFDGVCVVEYGFVRSTNPSIYFNNKKEIFSISISQKEMEELIESKKDKNFSLDPFQQNIVSDKQAIALLLNELEGLDLNPLDKTVNHFCQIVIQKDIHGEMCAMLVSEDGKERKISVVTALIFSMQRPDIELTACDTLFNQKKEPEDSLLDLEPL